MKIQYICLHQIAQKKKKTAIQATIGFFVMNNQKGNYISNIKWHNK